MSTVNVDLLEGPEVGLLLTSVPTVNVDLLDGFENEDQKPEKEKVEEPEVDDRRVD